MRKVASSQDGEGDYSVHRTIYEFEPQRRILSSSRHGKKDVDSRHFISFPYMYFYVKSQLYSSYIFNDSVFVFESLWVGFRPTKITKDYSKIFHFNMPNQFEDDSFCLGNNFYLDNASKIELEKNIISIWFNSYFEHCHVNIPLKKRKKINNFFQWENYNQKDICWTKCKRMTTPQEIVWH